MSKRYSPTSVSVYALNKWNWEKVVDYDDATVADIGNDGYLNAPQATLRAYSSDPGFFGDQEYQDGNGIHIGKDGMVYDCDMGLALNRTTGIVLSSSSWGHGSADYFVLIIEDNGKMRVEKWMVYIRDEN